MHRQKEQQQQKLMQGLMHLQVSDEFPVPWRYYYCMKNVSNAIVYLLTYDDLSLPPALPYPLDYLPVSSFPPARAPPEGAAAAAEAENATAHATSGE